MSKELMTNSDFTNHVEGYIAATRAAEEAIAEVEIAVQYLFTAFREIQKRFSAEYPNMSWCTMVRYSKKFGFTNNLPFSNITELSHDTVSIRCYQRGYCGDADYYPESSIPTSIVKLFFTDKAAFNKYIKDAEEELFAAVEKDMKKQQEGTEEVLRKQYETLKEKFEGKK